MLEAISLLMGVGEKLIDHFFPSKEAADKAKLELLKLQQSGALEALARESGLLEAQAKINLVEAGSDKTFVAGARPFLMWVCGAAFAYTYVLQPFAVFCYAAATGQTLSLPELNISGMMPVLLGMLGLGGMRSFEKVRKVQHLGVKG